MSDDSGTKSERLGLRGTFAFFESALRLVGGANATGAIAAGVAFHAFAQNADMQWSVKAAAVSFLFGIFAFIFGYMLLLISALHMNFSLYERDEKGGPDQVLWARKDSPEEYRERAKKEFWRAQIVGFVSFICFLGGLSSALALAVSLLFLH
jgi:hypothetical protein